jgi:sarcosine oxidase subunit alpha
MEEPNALVQLGRGERSVPNVPATQVDLVDGLEARAVNAWPSARRDVGSLLGWLGPFLPAGFYYKTFMWPSWHLFEPAIRRAAGLGIAPRFPDPDSYDFQYAHCDVLVVGSGPAGLAAADAACTAGARVILCESDTEFGGSLSTEMAHIGGLGGLEWAHRIVQRLDRDQDCHALKRCTAIGYFDHNTVVLLEDCKPSNGVPGAPRQRLWQVRAKRVVLAAGALERPIVFPGNDRPGVMLAGAVRRYIAQWAVVPGRRAIIFTNNDEAYCSARALRDAGASVVAIVDTRPDSIAAEAGRKEGFTVLLGAHVKRVVGTNEMRGASIRLADGSIHKVNADLLAMSGGYNPSVQLHRQSGGKLDWDEGLAAFLPAGSPAAVTSAGACAGFRALSAAVTGGHEAGSIAAQHCGFAPNAGGPEVGGDAAATPLQPFWRAPEKGKAFVDFQNDVTVNDISLAVREGYRSVEHLKRYTTLGMGTDQGKTSNVNGLAILAEFTGRTIPETGSTLARFPVIPVPIGALGGRRRGVLLSPLRRLPVEAMHRALGAEFEDYGGWSRPARYRLPGETAQRAEQREAAAVREAVGFIDNSPLGKIEVGGPDAGAFLDRVYANRMSNTRVGRAKYGLMLNERGAIIDDGVAARLSENLFVVGTTSSGAAHIAGWMEELLQCDWPELRVIVSPVTGSWAVPTLSGPNARSLLSQLGTDIDLSPDMFPHMAVRSGQVCGVPARVYRVSYTGETTYEINIPVWAADLVWEEILKLGPAFGMVPVGVEAVMLLRTEKGFIHIGSETDGSTVPDDIGWGHVLKRTDDFIGRRSLTMPENLRSDRLQFVGLRINAPTDGAVLPIGSHVCTGGIRASQGYVTSSGYSATLRRDVALAMVAGGRSRLGEIVQVMTGAGLVPATIVAPCAYDLTGSRLNG